MRELYNFRLVFYQVHGFKDLSIKDSVLIIRGQGDYLSIAGLRYYIEELARAAGGQVVCHLGMIKIGE